MTHRVNNDNNNTNQKASGRRARVLPKPKRLTFHPQRATRAWRLQLPVVTDVLELMPSPTWEGPLTPPATAGWKEGEAAFVRPQQEEEELASQPGPEAPVFGTRPLP